MRNLQARNFMRDKIKEGDTVLFYHSSTAIPGVAGLATVARAAYPDPDAADKGHPLYDAAHSEASPKWFAIDLRAVRPMAPYVSLTALREAAAREPAGAIAGMTLLKQPRLSVQPVTAEQLEAVLALEAQLQASVGADSSAASASGSSGSGSSAAPANGGAGSAKSVASVPQKKQGARGKVASAKAAGAAGRSADGSSATPKPKAAERRGKTVAAATTQSDSDGAPKGGAGRGSTKSDAAAAEVETGDADAVAPAAKRPPGTRAVHRAATAGASGEAAAVASTEPTSRPAASATAASTASAPGVGSKRKRVP